MGDGEKRQLFSPPCMMVPSARVFVMRIIRCNDALDAADLEQCSFALRQGGMICYPTETFYGLGIDPWNVKGRERLYRAKGREAEKDLPVIAGDFAMVERICGSLDLRVRRLASRFWPGPLTLVLPLKAGTSTLAVRVSAHPIARQISLAFGGPIVSTSANCSGESPVAEPAQLPQQILNEVDVLIDAGKTPGGEPSTIVAFTVEGVQILREGAIARVEILHALNLQQQKTEDV
jgi:L-threonylcarbamoyladenylate synthase